MKSSANIKLLQYVMLNYPREFEEVKRKNKLSVNNLLSIEEQTLIYKYTEDGYEELNQKLRLSAGNAISDFSSFLTKTLSKLPDYEDIIYRCADLTEAELKKYVSANQNNSTLVEHSFVSASKSKFIAYEFGRRCRFKIFSRTGKDIEAFAKYGSQHPQNEKEVLFRPNTGFKVLEITKDGKYTLITLDEIKK